MEEVIIRVLQTCDIKGERVSGMTGVWVNDKKIAAIGMSVSKWITMHGLSLNVDCNISGFAKIVPCGLEGKQVTTVKEWNPNVNVHIVRDMIVNEFGNVFNLEIERIVQKNL